MWMPILIVGLFLLAAVTLRYAQEVFLPLVLAGLLSFLLWPAVRRFERWHLGRTGAVLVTTALTFVLLGGVAYVVTSQFLELAGSLPKYRDNLVARVASLKTTRDNPLSLAAHTLTEVTAELKKNDEAASTTTIVRDGGRPVRVEVVPADDDSLHLLAGVVTPVIGPLANTMVVIVIVVFMLMAGEDLRDRLIHLLGRGRLRITTQALDDAGHRISRYLRAQLVVNAGFGVAIGVGLWFIGIPNAIFWGLLGMVLRFLPYVGAWIAAALPLALSVALFQSWTQPVLTFALFLGVELIMANVIEPWLYGASTEISPLAVVVSALFWTWLWGGVGLVLATPLTVCLAVAGKYLPDLAFLDLLMGDKPSIALGDRLYQRLLALNEDEANTIVEKQIRDSSREATFDGMVLPALRSVEADFRNGELSDSARGEIFEIVRHVVEEVGESVPDGPAPVARVVCIPANHEGDYLAGLMLAQVLGESGVPATVLSSKLLAAESVEQAAELDPAVICISALPPISSLAGRALCKRLRARLPHARIVVGLWETTDTEAPGRRERLTAAGANEVFHDLHHAAVGLIQLAACAPVTSTVEPVPVISPSASALVAASGAL